MPITREQFESSYGLYNALRELLKKNSDKAFTSAELSAELGVDEALASRELSFLERDGYVISHPYKGQVYYAYKRNKNIFSDLDNELLIKFGFIIVFVFLVISGLLYVF